MPALEKKKKKKDKKEKCMIVSFPMVAGSVSVEVVGLGVIPLVTLTTAPLLQDTLSLCLLWKKERNKTKTNNNKTKQQQNKNKKQKKNKKERKKSV